MHKAILSHQLGSVAPAPAKPHAVHAGFTLVEVMVSVAILAIALVAIFSSEAGAIKAAGIAKHTSTATLLARCKMAEIEEQISMEGLPAIDDSDSDICCEGAEIEGFTCDWSIERIILPDNLGVEDEGASDGEELLSGSGFTDVASNPQEAATAAFSAVGSGGFAQIAMDFAFPLLKPSIEEQVRRVTVEVKWNEGKRERSFEVVQFAVSEVTTTSQTGIPQETTTAPEEVSGSAE
ncbi:MAG: prepilin-type N-terminal cleavage/methylation domain-containing protein [Myxococcota bacterium]